ncbi:unnamed protein product [Leptidea sinapis]|uniref:BTB domain-containing protein n=1 Tax=Leptidea sinapis TaxID=189913 RepID=A0A5E4Q2H8_9NEOP|nr:unnamed protein product [Leptidea sinapis]
MDQSMMLEEGSITNIQECQSNSANKLCLLKFYYMLNNAIKKNKHDIGGTYTDSKADVWFYVTTTDCLAHNVLLNIFACVREVGFVTIGISDSNKWYTDNNDKKLNYYVFLPDSLCWQTFKATKRDESFHIRTYVFDRDCLQSFENKTLCIPIKIDISTFKLDQNIVDSVKNKHNIDAVIKKEKPDYTLVSADHKKFLTHKIILCMNSPVIRDTIKSTHKEEMFIDIDNETMDILMEYLYTGTIKDIENCDCTNLLQIAHTFQIKGMSALIELYIKQNITIKNAFDIAMTAHKYQLLDVQKHVCEFIQQNQQIFETDTWNNLNDVGLIKQILKDTIKSKKNN